MARKVYITSDISVDERLAVIAEANATAALMWPWILTSLDDWGRGEASALRLKLQVFPGMPSVEADLIERALLLYRDAGLICLYEVDGKRYMSIDTDKMVSDNQTHIRSEKRERMLEVSRAECMQMREDARDDAQSREGSRIATPFTFHLHLHLHFREDTWAPDGAITDCASGWEGSKGKKKQMPTPRTLKSFGE